jgi:hypothetical protein
MESLRAWASTVAQFAVHGSTDLVMRDQRSLEEEGLISTRTELGSSAPYVQADQSVFNKDGRITGLGISFCENIQTYKTRERGCRLTSSDRREAEETRRSGPHQFA